MTERERAVDLAIAQIERQFGKGSIMKMGEANSPCRSSRSRPGRSRSISRSASAAFRAAGSSRSTARSRPARRRWRCTSSPRRRSWAASRRIIDAEHALDPLYAERLGVNLDELLISQPDTGEQALEIAETLVRSGAIDVIVIDSVAALVPKAEIEGDMGDSHVGLQARLMSQALRKLTGAISRSKTSVIFINQLRMKIGVMFGSPETTTGGNALKFYCLGADGHPPDRDDQERHRLDRHRGRGSRSSRTRSRRRSARPSSTSCTTRASRSPAASSTSATDLGIVRRAAPGSTSTRSGSARAARTPRSSSSTIPDVLDEHPRPDQGRLAGAERPPRLRRRRGGGRAGAARTMRGE